MAIHNGLLTLIITWITLYIGNRYMDTRLWYLMLEYLLHTLNMEIL